MGENYKHTDEEIDDKLNQYKLINKQISKTLTEQRVEIASLKNSLNNSASVMLNLRNENHKWKSKFEALRELYIDHINSATIELQTNADKINSISVGDNNKNESSNPLASLSAAKLSKSTDDSRRVSKSFESAKNRSERTNSDIIDMDTIDEENSQELLAEINEESEVQSFREVIEDKTGGNDANIDDDNVDDSQEEGDTLEGTENSNERSENSNEGSENSNEGSENSNDGSEESDKELTSDEDSSDDEQEAIMKNKKSIQGVKNSKGVRVATVSSDEDSTSDEYQSPSSNDSSSDEEESSPSPRKKAIPVAASKGTKISNQVKSKKGAEDSVEIAQASNRGTAIEIENQSENISGEDSKSGSVEQISLLTTNCESTIKNDDSNKENDQSSTVDVSNSTLSIKGSQSVISAGGQSLNKSTTLKTLKILPPSKNIVNNSVNSLQHETMENQTFGPTKVKSLISSTPYRNNNISSNSAVEIAISSPALATRSRSTVVSMESQVTISSGSQSIAMSLSSRPKRKAAPVMLSEPKLNTKLRRPR